MTLPAAALSDLRDALGDDLKLDEPLARHTSARIGGPADAFLAARTQDHLRQVARIAWAHDVPLTILGGGSNVLVSGSGLRGIAVHNRTKAVQYDGDRVRAESGVSTISLARRLASRGLSGFEWAIGVPGTVGGAVYGNAGAHDGDMAGCVLAVDALTPGGDVRWTSAELMFEYRSSIIKREGWPCVLLAAEMQFTPADPATVKAKMADFNAYRKRTQPPGATIGSMFKNPPGDYAGRLIDAAGLKGTRIGGAQISEKHGNFFLNADDASAEDVQALIALARETVEARFGVRLALEVELLGEW